LLNIIKAQKRKDKNFLLQYSGAFCWFRHALVCSHPAAPSSQIPNKVCSLQPRTRLVVTSDRFTHSQIGGSFFVSIYQHTARLYTILKATATRMDSTLQGNHQHFYKKIK